MRIGEAAAATGLSAKSIRYYESLGLVQSRRLANGYRDYSDHALKELRLIANARQVGFSLQECRDLLALLNNRQRRSAHVRQQVLQKIAQLDVQIEQLSGMRNTLQVLASRCQGGDSPGCAILQDLSRPRTGMSFTLVENGHD